MFDYAARRRRLGEKMEQAGVDVLFLAPSADLEYLTGVERQIPNFGEASYAHGWVGGAFFRPGADPVFVFPRIFASFDLRESGAEGVLDIAGDATSSADVDAAVERAERELGPLDAIVCCAGTGGGWRSRHVRGRRRTLADRQHCR